MYVTTMSGADWQIAVLVAFGAFLMLVQSQHVSRRRLISAVLVLVLGLSCAVYAQQPVYDYCKELEPYSALWWLYGCWGIPDGK
jgi:hypothetical protein